MLSYRLIDLVEGQADQKQVRQFQGMRWKQTTEGVVPTKMSIGWETWPRDTILLSLGLLSLRTVQTQMLGYRTLIYTC